MRFNWSYYILNSFIKLMILNLAAHQISILFWQTVFINRLDFFLHKCFCWDNYISTICLLIVNHFIDLFNQCKCNSLKFYINLSILESGRGERFTFRGVQANLPYFAYMSFTSIIFIMLIRYFTKSSTLKKIIIIILLQW